MTKIEKASQMTDLVRKWKESGLSQRSFDFENGLSNAQILALDVLVKEQEV